MERNEPTEIGATRVRVCYDLRTFAEEFAEREGLDFAEAVRVIARDAGARDADDASTDNLARRLVIEHDDGSLEFTGGFWID